MKKHIFLVLMTILVPWLAGAQQMVTVTGTVTDPAGEPLVGVSVTVKNDPSRGALTDVNGKYSINVEQFGRLVFTYVGMVTQEVIIQQQRVVDIMMAMSEENAIEAVVMTALGESKRISVTAAQSTVAMSDLKRQSTSSITNALAGQIAGVFTQQTSGRPGSNTSEFWIRSISTFGAGSGAYILVDGFERNSIDELNIEDIASFTVLKDAAATAIYGTKGANGVVLITTKRGTAGKVTVDGKFESSVNMRTYTPEFVDGLTYANLANEARITRNMSRIYQPVELELIRTGADSNVYPNVDWTDILMKNSAMSYRANLNLSGGGNTARYFISGSYVEDQGMYKTDETLRDDYDTNANYNRWNYRMNVDVNITKTTVMKVGVAGSLELQNEPGVSNGDIWGVLFGYNALSTPIFFEEDGVRYAPTFSDQDSRMNPWTAATQTGYAETWKNNLQTNITVEQNLNFLTEGLKLTARFGYDTNNSSKVTHRTTPAMYRYNGRNQDTGKLILERRRDPQDMTQSSTSSGDRREFLDLMFNYNRKFGEHNLSGALRYTSDVKRQTVDYGTDLRNSVAFRNLNLAGQMAWNWKLRYFVDVNFGYSGSENFSDGHRFGFFPAYSLAWNVAEESFIKGKQKWLSMFKIRFSHGQVGNDKLYIGGALQRFPYLYTIGDGAGFNYGFGAGGDSDNIGTGLIYSQVASPGVTWEIATKKDLGFDLSILNDKFSLTMDYFDEKRTGIYMERAYLPEITGLTSRPRANVGEVKARGFDGNFAFKQRFGEVNLTLRGNISYGRNEVVEQDEQWQVYPYLYNKGYRVDQQKGLVALGLFSDYDDIRNSPTQAWGAVQPGDIKYADVNGDGVVNDDDRVAIGATTRPNLGYGMGFSVSWKGFDLNMHFQGAGRSTFPIFGKCVYAFSEGSWGNIFAGMIDGRYVDAETASILGIAANEDPNAIYPRLSYGGSSNNYMNSTYWMRDGRYIRLKNVDLGYTLPTRIANKMYMNSVRIFVSASNLFTWAPFTMWDPESAAPRGEDYPLTKSVTMGISVNL